MRRHQPILLSIVVAASLAACERHEPKNTDPFSTAEKHPEPATKASSTPASGGAVDPSLAAVIPADAQPGPTAGAEASPSKGTGPGNGSTAVGGKTQ